MDGIQAELMSQRDGLRQRLGQYQALCIEWLAAVASDSFEGVQGCGRDAAVLLREDVGALQAAASRLEPRTVDGPRPTPHQAWLETRVEELNQEVADIDAQRAAAVKEAAELRESLGPWQERVQHLETVRAELLNQRNEATDLLRERTADLEGRLSRLTSQLGQLQEQNARLREEVDALRKLGGWTEGTLWVDAETKAAHDAEVADRMVAQSIAEAEVAPEPDLNHTETIPAKRERRKPQLSEEQRQAASERIRAMQAERARRKRMDQEAREAAARENAASALAAADVVVMPAPIAAEVVVTEAPDETLTIAAAEPTEPAGRRTLSARLDAAEEALRWHLDNGNEITDAVISAIAGDHDLSVSGVERLLSARMIMANIRHSGRRSAEAR